MFKKFIIVLIIFAGVAWILTPPRAPLRSEKEIVFQSYDVSEKKIVFQSYDVIELLKPIPIVHKDRIMLPNNMLCPQWAQLSIDTGWREEDLAMLDHIMHRESRCFSAVHYSQDPNGGSYGLMQINAFWCKPSDWYPNGYLQAFGILKHCDELFQPRTNLLSARLIWLYSLRKHDNGWLPWRT